MTAGADRPREPLRDVAIYNPDLLRKDELVAYFIARQPLFERILQDLQQGGAAQHHLLIGTRGMGKTTLLKRIRFGIEDDATLAGAWLPLTFPEEQYSVTRLSDLYLNCIDALSDALEQRGKRADAKALDAEVAALSTESEDERSRRALAILLHAADGAKKRLVLLLDNIDILFDRLKDQSWALRELLSREDRLMVIGASASHPEETYTYGAAFYDFFKVHELRGLPEMEARQLLLHLSDLRGTAHVRRVVEAEPARLRTLHTLSGGNPRTLVLLYFVLAQSTEGDAQDDLERLLDHTTPLYKARIEALPAQAQKIVDSIAIHWHPITAAETAARTRLDVGLVSSQITRLVRDGVLERCPTPAGSKSAYQIAERLLNIWYLMRQSRRVRQRLVWLVEFLRLFYGSQELTSHARAHLDRDAPSSHEGRVRHVEYRLALADAVNEPSLKMALESVAVHDMMADARLREEIGKIVDLDGADESLRPVVDKHRAAIEVRELVLHANVKRESWDPESFADLLGGAISLDPYQKLWIAESLGQLGPTKIDELARTLEDEQRHFASVYRSTDLVRELSRAIRSGHMAGQDDVDGARAASVVLGESRLPIVAILIRLEKGGEEALLVAAMAELRAGADFAYACAQTGAHMARAGRHADAESGYRRAIALDGTFARPWYNLGHLLQEHLGRFGEAEEAYRHAIAIDPNFAHPWNGLGNLLQNHLGRLSEAEEAYRTAIAINAGFVHPWNNLGNLLQKRLGRLSEAEEAYRTAITIDPAQANTWTNLGYLLHARLGRFSEAEEAYRTAIAIDPAQANTWTNLGSLLQDELGRFSEAEDAYRKAIAIDPTHANPWNHLGRLLQFRLDRRPEAEDAYRQATVVDPGESSHWNGLAWCRFLNRQVDDETERAARTALKLEGDNRDAAHTLACILARRDSWSEPFDLMARIIEGASEDYLERIWTDVLRFFAECLRARKVAESIAMLDRMGFGERWLPLRAALAATVEGRDSLLAIAPELRTPAEKILEVLLTLSGVTIDAPKSSPKSRRQ